MAELQWAVQVKCVNALLAEIEVGEKGELIIVNIPDMNFGPSEFVKLIEGLEVARKISDQNRRSLYQLRLLRAGEIIRVNVPDMLFTPSEVERFLKGLKNVSHTMAELKMRSSRS